MSYPKQMGIKNNSLFLLIYSVNFFKDFFKIVVLECIEVSVSKYIREVFELRSHQGWASGARVVVGSSSRFLHPSCMFHL